MLDMIAAFLAAAALSIGVAPAQPVAQHPVTLSATHSTCVKQCTYKWYNSARYLGVGRSLRIAFPAGTVHTKLKVYDRKGALKGSATKTFKVVKTAAPTPPVTPPVTTPTPPVTPPVTTPTPPVTPPVTTPVDPTPADCTASVTPSSLAATFAKAGPGDVLCLASGSYSFSGGTKSGMVTLTPASGASVTMSANFAPSAFITLQNMTVSNLGVSGKSHDIKILNNAFTGQANLNMTGNANANILVDGNSFDGISVCADCAEGRLEIGQYPSGTAPVGVTISHNHFGGGGQSDGIQDGAYGVIIDSNEFDGVQQLSGYTRHIDSIQLYGASHTQITNNYLHNFTTAIMAPDGGDREIVSHNVFDHGANQTGAALQFGHHDTLTFTHNTVRGTDIFVFVGAGDNDPNRNAVLRDNVLDSAQFNADGCQNCAIDHNTSGPRYVGGSSPAAFGGFRLSPSSPGHNAASDGTDTGI